MHSLIRAIVNFVKKEDGPTAVEYAILLAMFVTVCIGLVTAFGSSNSVMSSSAPAAVAILGRG